ncbi:MAG TPA: alpha/beta fold hydrolase, partial [Pyrinomonadaceae bacterium]
RSGATGVYPLMYYNHNIHMLAASHAGAGNFAGAIQAAKELETNVKPNVKAMPMLEMFMPYHLVTLARFQKWDDILAYPQPEAEMKVTNAIWRLARGLAYNEKGRTREAEAEQNSLRTTVGTIPADAGIGNSSAHGVLKVATELLLGEIAFGKGDTKSGIDALRRAVAAEDLVNYNEPPDWHLPTREWLGRALMRAGQFAEAEAVFRKEIEKNPKNGRGLFGLAEALEKQGKATSAALVRKEFEAAWKDADTKLSTASFDGKAAGSTGKTGKLKLKTGITLSYQELGDPKGPALMLVHGYGDSSFSFSRTAPLIDQRYRIIVPDQRGHGESDKPESGYAMKDLAADLAGLMDALNIRSATVVGHSMGSFVSMQLALDHPSKVERLVLIGTAATANNTVVKELQAVVSQLIDPVPQEFIREFQSGASSPLLPKEFFEGVIGASSKVPANVWKKIAAGLMATDYTERLGRITVPVTIFWGEKETIFSRAEQEPLLRGLPNVKFIVYPDSGHSPNWEEPEKFSKDLNEILAEKHRTVE